LRVQLAGEAQVEFRVVYEYGDGRVLLLRFVQDGAKDCLQPPKVLEHFEEFYYGEIADVRDEASVCRF
jgi:hypothetical protein